MGLEKLETELTNAEKCKAWLENMKLVVSNENCGQDETIEGLAGAKGTRQLIEEEDRKNKEKNRELIRTEEHA